MEIPCIASLPTELVPFIIDMTHAFIAKMDDGSQKDSYLIDNISSITFVMKWIVTRLDDSRQNVSRWQQWLRLLPFDIIAATLPMAFIRDKGLSDAICNVLCKDNKHARAIFDGQYDVLKDELTGYHEHYSRAFNIALAYRDKKAMSIIINAPTNVSKCWYLRYITAARCWRIPPDDETIMACVNYDMFVDEVMAHGWNRYEDAGRFIISVVMYHSSRIVDHCLLPPQGREVKVEERTRMMTRVVDWINKYGSGITWKSAIYLLSIGLPVDAGTMIQMIDNGYLAVILTHTGTAHVNTYHDRNELLRAAARVPRNGRVAKAIYACTPNVSGKVAIRDVHRAYTMTAMGVGRDCPHDVAMIICDDE